MNSFESIETIYDHLESEAFHYKYLRQISDVFIAFRDRSVSSGDESTLKLAQYEVDAFGLQSKEGILGPMFIYENEKGEPFGIPDIESFTEDELRHFEKRLEQSKNPRLRARYAHILWQSHKKHRNYAKIAIECYINQISHFASIADEFADDDTRRAAVKMSVVESLRSGLSLSLQSQQLEKDMTSVVWNMIDDQKLELQWHFPLFRSLIELVLDMPKAFRNCDMKILSPRCETEASDLESKGDYHAAIQIFALGMRLDNQLQQNTTNWNSRIARCYEKLMTLAEKSPITASEWCQRAINHFKAAGENDKVEELSKKREKFSGEIEFETVSTQIDLTDYINWCDKVSKELCQQESNSIIAFIAHDPNLIPQYADMELRAMEFAKQSPLLSFIPEQVLDDRLHVTEHFVTEEEKAKRRLLSEFGLSLDAEKLPLLNSIICHAYSTGKINEEKVIGLLASETWLGSTLMAQRGSNKNYSYRWLDQLFEAIRGYFACLKEHISGKEPTQSLIPVIDSMTLKFEGMVRDFAKRYGISTHYDMPDNQGRAVTRERDLGQLLRDPNVSGLFSEDDLLLFKFLFVEHTGMALRHKVAHALLPLEGYNTETAHLLFVALLRISKYLLPVIGQSGGAPN